MIIYVIIFLSLCSLVGGVVLRVLFGFDVSFEFIELKIVGE